jgi:hypothetical protein
MRKILNISFALCILAASVTPALAYRYGERYPSNIAPGTRFGREPMAHRPYPYLYPVNPELWRQEQRERRELESPAAEKPQTKPAESETPARPKPPIHPKFIEVK